jgi:CheY-like chemotaxis protein
MSLYRLSGRTIVVVEDHEEVRMAMATLLNRMGATVVTAKDGFEGIGAVKSQHPHLVITDLYMPGMDGFELLREIRALGQDAGGDTPVIAMTAMDTRVERARILNLGFQACLQKPFAVENLLETMLSLLDD